MRPGWRTFNDILAIVLILPFVIATIVGIVFAVLGDLRALFDWQLEGRFTGFLAFWLPIGLLIGIATFIERRRRRDRQSHQPPRLPPS